MNNFGNSSSIGYRFERLVVELLVSLGFTQVEPVSGPKDPGYDIQATYPYSSSLNPHASQLWIVTIKHQPFARVSAHDLDKVLRLPSAMRADKVLFVTSGNLTSSKFEYLQKLNKEFPSKLEIWDRDRLVNLLTEFPQLQQEYSDIISAFPTSLSNPQNSGVGTSIQRLIQCPVGRGGWLEYEKLCEVILTEALVPPLKRPKVQARTFSGLERRDVLFPLRGVKFGWEDLSQEFESKFLLCEFKNFTDFFTKDEVNQTRNYLKGTIGRLAIIFSRKGADESAKKMRNSIYAEEKKVILFLEDDHLIEMLKLKRAGQNPLDLIQDEIDNFYVFYE